MKITWENSESGHHKVLIHIKWNSVYYHYFLNAGAYNQEKEVLLYDGAYLYVHSVESIIDKDEKLHHYLIVLGSKAIGYVEPETEEEK